MYSACNVVTRGSVVGWGVAELLSTRLLPLWFGARATEFNWRYIQSSFDTNINMVSS